MSFKTNTIALSIASILAASTFLAGCTHSASSTPIVISQDTSGIVVAGHGEVEAIPNVAVLNIGVESIGATVAEAREKAAKSANAIHESFEHNGIAKEDIKTADLSISPRYEYRENKEPLITGYAVSNTVTIKVRRMADVSRVVDDAVAAGGDAVRMNGIHFEVAEADQLRTEARAKALKEARAKAEQLASLTGVELGEPLSVEETSVQMPMVPGYFGRAEDASATPVEPGTATVGVDVRVRWSIGG